MRTVREVMSSDIEVLRTTETVADAASYLATHDEETVALCLVDGSLAGSVSSRDIVAKVVAKGLDPRAVHLAELAGTDDAVAVDIDLSVADAVTVMCRHHRARLPVLEADRVVGSVTRRDAARVLSFGPVWADTEA